MMKAFSFPIAVAVFVMSGCQPAKIPEEPKGSPLQQELRITLGGFIDNHPDRGSLKGVCGTDATRNVLNCDIYNGLLDWRLTEITLMVTWWPYNDDDKRYYREVVSIEPLKSGQVSIKLALQLPLDDVIKRRDAGSPVTMKHWNWLIAGAKGLPAR